MLRRTFTNRLKLLFIFAGIATLFVLVNLHVQISRAGSRACNEGCDLAGCDCWGEVNQCNGSHAPVCKHTGQPLLMCFSATTDCCYRVCRFHKPNSNPVCDGDWKECNDRCGFANCDCFRKHCIEATDWQCSEVSRKL